MAGWLAEYFNRTGSVIVVLTLIFLAIIISTQVSFGRVFAGLLAFARDGWTRTLASYREWREERRRELSRRTGLERGHRVVDEGADRRLGGGGLEGRPTGLLGHPEDRGGPVLVGVLPVYC